MDEIAAVGLGHSFRAALSTQGRGRERVIQSRDLSNADRIDPGALARADLPGVADRHRVVDGDVLLQSRGGRYPALVAPGAVAGAVAAAPLFLIRPRVDRIAADYLAAILNAPVTQARLSGAAVGTHVPQVPAEAIRSLPIPLPDLDEQRAIAALDALFRREARLAAELAERRAAWLLAHAQQRDAAA